MRSVDPSREWINDADVPPLLVTIAECSTYRIGVVMAVYARQGSGGVVSLRFMFGIRLQSIAESVC